MAHLVANQGFDFSVASVVVFAELDWVPSTIRQAEDRLRSKDRKENLLVLHLVLDGSVDQRLAQVIVAKQEVIDKGLGDLDEDAPVNPDDLTPKAAAAA